MKKYNIPTIVVLISKTETVYFVSKILKSTFESNVVVVRMNIWTVLANK